MEIGVGGYSRRVIAALAIAVAALGATGCETGSVSNASFTTSTLYPCSLDSVVLDPDGTVAALEPGCTTSFVLEPHGPGGMFDLVMEDTAGGFSMSDDFDAYWLTDATRFDVEHTAGESWADSIEISVDLAPNRHHGGCDHGSRGASTSKVFPVDSSRDCVVTFRVTDEIDLGGIELEVDYGPSGAAVPGCGGAPACVGPSWAGSELGIGSDHDAATRLHLGWVSGQGFSAPIDLARCYLRKASGADDPQPADFMVAVTGSYGPLPLGRPIDPPPNVAVEVSCSFASTTTTTLPYAPADCGHPCSGTGAQPTAVDALYVLRAATGSVACKTCICDVDRSGSADATDALTVLARAVGLDVLMRCVICADSVAPDC